MIRQVTLFLSLSSISMKSKHSLTNMLHLAWFNQY